MVTVINALARCNKCKGQCSEMKLKERCESRRAGGVWNATLVATANATYIYVALLVSFGVERLQSFCPTEATVLLFPVFVRTAGTADLAISR